MAAHAEEHARDIGDFRCARRHGQADAARSKKIPGCPNCGTDAFDTRYPEPDNTSS